MGRTKKITDKQKLFIREYLVDLNASQAAIRAGYNPKTAGAMGHELLKKPEIADAIALAVKKRAKRTQTTADWVIRYLRIEARRRGDGSSHSARVQALVALGKHLQMFEKRDSLEATLAWLGPELGEAVRAEIIRLRNVRKAGERQPETDQKTEGPPPA